MKKLGLIHTSATLVPVFAELCQAKLPCVATFNIADDSLIKEVIEKQELTRSVSRRVGGHVQAAQQAGADCILVTCSSIGPAVEAAAALADVPVVRVDLAMADKAVQMGAKIGVAATLPTTLAPTADLIRRRAEAAGKEIEIVDRLCDGAFEALMSGDSAKHDAMVGDALRQLAAEVDVVVLAQASMARVADQLDPAEVTTPVLSSPALAIEALAEQAM
ncbi:Asp/Glu/Hydantoin racemase [Posidoniimonas polymericola]|uniref:Asp/Glu/Hydantoin racemase n=1 Tax=Posidoniimonas polymericola TaxID=2528002 RepID=A0A5C5ZF97_9BACT|nr:aspartate/glutamate racemase family protein [Posidoniimonas polymericola]TWT86002.1 Asp/Glu/Hydantoin racemase [Posidoniimonas polymericola]